MAAHLGIKLINRGEEGELLLKGRLDSVTSEEAAEYLEAAANRFEHLILNMEELDYISSAGLRVLLMMQKGSKNGVTLSGINNVVSEILKQTGFDQVLVVE